jgi:ribosome biogenesis protein Tsr3
MLQICYLKPEQLDLIRVVAAAAAVVDVVAAADVLLSVSFCWETPLMLLPAHTLHAEYGAL